MKKIITLLFCTAVLTSAFAQSDDRDRDGRSDRYNGGYNNTVYQNNSNYISQRDMQIQRISNQYDYKIQHVSYDRSLSRREKRRTIRDLQDQKTMEINCIYSQYNNSNVYNNEYDRNSGQKQSHHDEDHDNRNY